MATTPVTSKDPRKPAVVAALKRISKCTKVTTVQAHGEGLFSGACLRRLANGKYDSHIDRVYIAETTAGNFVQYEPVRS